MAFSPIIFLSYRLPKSAIKFVTTKDSFITTNYPKNGGLQTYSEAERAIKECEEEFTIKAKDEEKEKGKIRINMT